MYDVFYHPGGLMFSDSNEEYPEGYYACKNGIVIHVDGEPVMVSNS